jgi:hypothetical protein
MLNRRIKRNFSPNNPSLICEFIMLIYISLINFASLYLNKTTLQSSQ